MSPTVDDFIIFEGHRDAFEVTRRRRQGEQHPLAEGLLSRFIAGGYTAVTFIVGGDSTTHRDGDPRPLEGSLDVLDFFVNECQAAGGRASIIRTKEDVPTEPNPGHVRFFMELEGGRPFQEDYSSARKRQEKLAALRAFYRLGVRGVQLTHNGRNELGDGCDELRTGGRLSEFGRAVVQEMNRLHMLVGVSHLNDEGFFDVLEVSSDPIVASHSNARSVYNHPRNLSDAQIRALAERGGVVGIHFWVAIVRDVKSRPSGRATIEDFIRHVDHVAELVGPRHIGFGILGNDPTYTQHFPHTAVDTIYVPGVPDGLELREQASLLIEALDKRGYSREDINGITGANFARVMREVLPARGFETIW